MKQGGVPYSDCAMNFMENRMISFLHCEKDLVYVVQHW